MAIIPHSIQYLYSTLPTYSLHLKKKNMGIPVDGTTTHEEEEEDLFKRVEKGLRSALQLNQTWDAMPCAWLTAWRQSHEASPSSSSSPPSCAPIDFSPLIEAASTKGREREEEEEVFSLTPMRRGLIEGEDFVWLPHDLVTSLIRRYGTILSQTTRISRRVVRVGRADSSFLQIETHPPFVRIFDAKGNALRADYFSRKTPLSTLMMSRNGSDGGSKMCLTFSETKEEEGASSSFHLTLKNRLWCAVSEGNAAPSIAFKEGERPAAAGMKITSDFTDCIAHQEVMPSSSSSSSSSSASSSSSSSFFFFFFLYFTIKI